MIMVPGFTTQITHLMTTDTSHMVASLFPLNNDAAYASLIIELFCHEIYMKLLALALMFNEQTF